MLGNSGSSRCCLLLALLCAGNLLFAAQNRYALIIGNEHYRDGNILSLETPLNDAVDMAQALESLGYAVNLKTNAEIREMRIAVRQFTENLRKNPENEGFFWFAGHGLFIRGVHYLLPVDTDTANDALITQGSYSVDELLEEIARAGNKTNLIVIDACKNRLLPGMDGAHAAGIRGPGAVHHDDPRISRNKIVYSTMEGRAAIDGLPGSRNSPFAQAFLSHIQSDAVFDEVFHNIASETLRLTRGEQEPYAIGAFAVERYRLKPLPAGTARARIPARPGRPPAMALDGKKVFGASAPFNNAVSLRYERYRDYGAFFLLPNSIFTSITETEDSGALSLGALWKIRLGQDQRFIAHLGPSASFSFADTSLADIGLNAGLSFRFSRYVSLDLNVKAETERGAFISRGFDFSHISPAAAGLGISLWLPSQWLPR